MPECNIRACNICCLVLSSMELVRGTKGDVTTTGGAPSVGDATTDGGIFATGAGTTAGTEGADKNACGNKLSYYEII